MRLILVLVCVVSSSWATCVDIGFSSIYWEIDKAFNNQLCYYDEVVGGQTRYSDLSFYGIYYSPPVEYPYYPEKEFIFGSIKLRQRNSEPYYTTLHSTVSSYYVSAYQEWVQTIELVLAYGSNVKKVKLFFFQSGKFQVEIRRVAGSNTESEQVSFDYDLGAGDGVEMVRSHSFNGKTVYTYTAEQMEHSSPRHVLYTPDPGSSSNSSYAVEQNSWARSFNSSKTKVIHWWPPENYGDYSGFNSITPITLHAHKYSNGWGKVVPNPNQQIQTIGTNVHLPRYFIEGSDQALTAELEYYGSNPLIFGGKAIIKNPARHLKVYVSDQFHNNPTISFDASDRSTVTEMGKTFNSALDLLIPIDNVITYDKTISTPASFPWDGSAVTPNVLHDWMKHSMVQFGYSKYQKNWHEDVKYWHVFVNLVNWRLNVPNSYSVFGMMFDYSSLLGFSTNVERQGIAIFREVISNLGQFPTESHRKRIMLKTILHEIGHTMNLNHNWAKSSGSIMTSPVLLDNGSMTWSDDCFFWVNYAPEAWVKPGRNGTHWYEVSQMPDFTP